MWRMPVIAAYWKMALFLAADLAEQERLVKSSPEYWADAWQDEHQRRFPGRRD